MKHILCDKAFFFTGLRSYDLTRCFFLSLVCLADGQGKVGRDAGNSDEDVTKQIYVFQECRDPSRMSIVFCFDLVFDFYFCVSVAKLSAHGTQLTLLSTHSLMTCCI